MAQLTRHRPYLIFVGDILAGVNQAAQLRKGNFTPDPISVGDLFAGTLIPGFIMVGIYLLWITYKAIFQPETVPALEMSDADRSGLPRRVFSALVPPLLLILAVLGSIMLGFATPTESASVGAIGAMILAAMNRRLSFEMIYYAAAQHDGDDLDHLRDRACRVDVLAGVSRPRRRAHGRGGA